MGNLQFLHHFNTHLIEIIANTIPTSILEINDEPVKAWDFPDGVDPFDTRHENGMFYHPDAPER